MRLLPKAGPNVVATFLLLVASGSACGERPVAVSFQSQKTDSQKLPPAATGTVLLTPAQLESLLPATVYFRDKTAPIQLRNAAGVRFGTAGDFLAAMVDTSGYASSVQETYQLYLITENAVVIGGQHLNPGAYGAGVVNGKFIVMDIGGHTLLQASATLDERMPRPRPLQLLSGSNGEVRLYVGRSWVAIAPADLR